MAGVGGELRGWLADLLVGWAWRLDPQRFCSSGEPKSALAPLLDLPEGTDPARVQVVYAQTVEAWTRRGQAAALEQGPPPEFWAEVREALAQNDESPDLSWNWSNDDDVSPAEDERADQITATDDEQFVWDFPLLSPLSTTTEEGR